MPDSLSQALAQLQVQLPRIAKDSEARIPGKDGRGGYSYKYADLATISHQILPLMAMLGLSFTAFPTMAGDRFVLHYSLLHDSGSSLDGDYPLPAGGTPQAIGSAITYARRYCLCAVTGVVADEDDDGQEAEVSAGRLIEEARALRRLPPEVDEHGAATQAEITRMSTGPEPGTERVHAPVEDVWTTGAPSWTVGVDPPEDEPGSILDTQRSQIMGLYGALKIKGHDERVADMRRVLTIADLESTNQLSYKQAGVLLEALHDRQSGRMTKR